MSAPKSKQGHRWFAAMWDRISASQERTTGTKVRPKIMGEAHGDVLEIGAGTGASFSYFPEDAQVIAIEPDPHMIERAHKRLAKLGAVNIQLRQAAAESLPFDDDSFDHVVASLVFCSVDDQAKAFAEVRRVLRPDGTFRFWEHIRNDDSRFWGTLQDAITPIWRWCGAGCHPNRRTQQAIEEAGFTVEWIEKFRAAPGTPEIYGVARPG
ncbi:MAG: class I SAM-dependent methyltransferase [Chloroflexi bacterium]|nr:class I SAM-dependent methyltransferase [Chloroflexota bacterium]